MIIRYQGVSYPFVLCYMRIYQPSMSPAAQQELLQVSGSAVYRISPSRVSDPGRP